MEAKTKEEYENLINHSPLFGTDPGASTQYKSEERRLIELVFKYYKAWVCPSKPTKKYDLPLLEAVKECIKNYDPSKGPFLSYLYKVFSIKYMVDTARGTLDEHRGGIKTGKGSEALIRQINRYASSRNLDTGDPVVQEKLAEAMGIPVHKVRYLIQMNANATTVPSTVQDNEGSGMDIFETIADLTASAEDLAVQSAALLELVARINTLFRQLRHADQRSIISKLLTADILKEFSMDTVTVMEYIGAADFFSMEEMEYCCACGKVHTQKEIGEIFGRSESSISTTYSDFKAKIINGRQ